MSSSVICTNVQPYLILYVLLRHDAAVGIFSTYCCCSMKQPLASLGFLETHASAVVPSNLTSTHLPDMTTSTFNMLQACCKPVCTSTAPCEVAIGFGTIGITLSHVRSSLSLFLKSVMCRSVLFRRWLTVGEATLLFLWVIAMGSQCWQGNRKHNPPTKASRHGQTDARNAC